MRFQNGAGADAVHGSATNGFAMQRLLVERRDAGYVFDRTNADALARYIELLRSCEIRNLGRPLSKGGYRVLGGKNVGILLLQKLLIDGHFGEYERVTLGIPDTIMLGSEFFYAFLNHNPSLKEVLTAKLGKRKYEKKDYDEIKDAFRNACLPPAIENELTVLLHKFDCEFYFMRSSGSCEDGVLPSAGVFESLPFYNDVNAPVAERLRNMEIVLKNVWASLFSPDAVDMMRRAGLESLSESMSVTIQPVIGEWYGKYFFPYMSGVVKSTNNWPWESVSRFDPVGRIGLGLGTFMVGNTGSFREGGPRVFSFRKDGRFDQFAGISADAAGHAVRATELIDHGQTKIDVLEAKDGRAEIRRLDLYYNTGREDNDAGVAKEIPPQLREIMASVRLVRLAVGTGYCEVYDALELEKHIRRGNFFEIGKAIRRVMDELRQITKEDVSMEFTIKPVRNADGWSFVFYLLQVRPQTASSDERQIPMTDLGSGGFSVLVKTDTAAFGHVETNLDYIVVMTPELLLKLGTRRAKLLLREADEKMRGGYLLVGPNAEAFAAGENVVFESVYGGLSPGAVISLKNPTGIQTLAGGTGSHAMDNIERAPVAIVDTTAMRPELAVLLQQFNQRTGLLERIGRDDITIAKPVKIELDGRRGCGQMFYKEQTF